MQDIINGVVYRDNDQLYLISFFNEKKYEIFDKLYFSFVDKKPLEECVIVLVNFEEQSKNTFKTKPILDFKVTFKKKSVPVKRLDIDTIIDNSYRIAGLFLKNKKNKIINEDIV